MIAIVYLISCQSNLIIQLIVVTLIFGLFHQIHFLFFFQLQHLWVESIHFQKPSTSLIFGYSIKWGIHVGKNLWVLGISVHCCQNLIFLCLNIYLQIFFIILLVGGWFLLLWFIVCWVVIPVKLSLSRFLENNFSQIHCFCDNLRVFIFPYPKNQIYHKIN